MSFFSKRFKKQEPEIVIKKSQVNRGDFFEHFYMDDADWQAFTDIENLKDEDKEKFMIEAEQLYKSPFLRAVLFNTLHEIMKEAFNESNAEEFFYDRFESKGIWRVWEKIKLYASRVQKTENFDPHDYL